MHELYVEKIDKTDYVDDIDEVINKAVSSVPNIPQKIDDLGLENLKCTENLGKEGLGCSDKQESDDNAHNKVADNPVVESFDNPVDEEHAVEDAAASNVKTNLETTVVPESPEMTVGSDK
ncbi:hypothetical protein A2U01_0058106, partial [Trifolium medium]|nr:hypothetical protein [Trifolium medium]